MKMWGDAFGRMKSGDANFGGFIRERRHLIWYVPVIKPNPELFQKNQNFLRQQFVCLNFASIAISLTTIILKAVLL